MDKSDRDKTRSFMKPTLSGFAVKWSGEIDMKEREMNFDVKTKKIVQKLQGLGKKYGGGSPAENTIESHHQFRCKMADGTTRDIIIVLREEDTSVFFRPNPPQWFQGSHQVDDALKEVERLLESPN